MLKGQHILCISSIDWDFIWQGHQQIMSTLAEQGNQVLFIENTGVRRPSFRDVPRLNHRLRRWWRSTKGFRQESENLFIYSPLVLPFPYSRIARWINKSIIVRAVRRWMMALNVQRPLVWTFLPTPLAREVIRGVDPELVVYYCIDDFEASSPGARAIRKSEDRLLGEADLVFVTSHQLRERAEKFRDQVDVFPFAVDYERFERVREGGGDIPAELVGLPRPIIGYVGGLHRFIDQELVAGAARRMPEATFVFIGPPQCDLSILEEASNVVLLGARSHQELPSYIRGFDVGIIPYVRNDYTANVYPTKLNEYLAMGIPVVATSIPEILRFNAGNDEVVAVADEPSAFSEKLISSSKDRSAAADGRRIEVARQNSWSARLDGMVEIIRARLAARRAQPRNWEETLRRIYRRGRRRVAGVAGLALILYLIVFHSPLLWFVAEPLRVEDPPRPVDAIAVFAGGVGESAEAGGGYQERVRHAVELYRQGYAPLIVFSSGYTFAFREAEIMRALAVALGVPPEAILIEAGAASTYENVVFVGELLRANGADSAILVSSPYHMRRAIWTWEEQAPDIEVLASPVPNSQFYARGEGVRLRHIEGIAWEYAAIVAYWVRGML